jgi:hypothetical protein
MTTVDDHDRPAPNNRMRLLGPRPATGDGAGGPPVRRLRRTRAVIAWVLVVLAVLLVPISVVTVWAVNTVTDTDHYVATLAPLARERVVTDYVAMDATNKLFEKVNVQQKLTKALPKQADFIAAPLTGTLHSFVQRQLTDLLRSTWFHDLWDNLNRKSHTAVVNILTGKTVPGQRANRVLVNLTPVLTKAIGQLDARGVTLFDPLRAQLAHAQTVTLELASSRQISKARNFFRVASDLGWAAPLLAVVAIVLALVVAVDRRKTLLRVAVGVALLTVVLLGALALGRSFFLSHAAARVPPTVTGAIFDTVIRFLRAGLKWVLLIAVAVAALLWLVGPARWPRWLRAQAARAVRWAGRRAAELGNEQNRRRASAATRRGAAWCLEHASGVRLLGVVVAGIVLVFGGNLSVSGVWWTVVGVAIYLVVVEGVLAWARRAAAAAAGPATAGPATAGPVTAGEATTGPAAAGPATTAPPLVEPVAVGVPALPGDPLGEEGDRRSEHPGDDDHDDQRGLP